jgi:hypothetical protein
MKKKKSATILESYEQVLDLQSDRRLYTPCNLCFICQRATLVATGHDKEASQVTALYVGVAISLSG